MDFAGDFNAQSESWWIDGDTNNEGLKLANTFPDLDMIQPIFGINVIQLALI